MDNVENKFHVGLKFSTFFPLMFISCYAREKDKNNFTFVCVIYSNLLLFFLSYNMRGNIKERKKFKII